MKAYADDVTIFVTKPDDFRVIREAMRCYEKVSGAHLKFRNSQALADGEWDRSVNDLGVEVYTSIKILRITFSCTNARAMRENWTRITARIKAHTS